MTAVVYFGLAAAMFALQDAYFLLGGGEYSLKNF